MIALNKHFFENKTNIVGLHKLPTYIYQVTQTLSDDKKNPKREYVDSQITIFIRKINLIYLYRQYTKIPKQPEKMANIEIIYTQNHEMNCLYCTPILNIMNQCVKSTIESECLKVSSSTNFSLYW